jgi:hypothetical protein
MFQVFPHDRGQNYSIELAERLVVRLEGGPRASTVLTGPAEGATR